MAGGFIEVDPGAVHHLGNTHLAQADTWRATTGQTNTRIWGGLMPTWSGTAATRYATVRDANTAGDRMWVSDPLTRHGENVKWAAVKYTDTDDQAGATVGAIPTMDAGIAGAINPATA